MRISDWSSDVCSSDLSELQRRKARQREHEADDPEADDHGRFRPSEMLEMMVNGSHSEHALAGGLVACDLHDHRHRFKHEQAADDSQIGRASCRERGCMYV